MTRVAAVVNCAVRHGNGFVPGVKGQPAITYGDVINTVGWPSTVTRGFGTVGVARPMCTHCAAVVAVTSGPGMGLL
jgi:hypothetical protein